MWEIHFLFCPHIGKATYLWRRNIAIKERFLIESLQIIYNRINTRTMVYEWNCNLVLIQVPRSPDIK